jgi:hypothetical protein
MSQQYSIEELLEQLEEVRREKRKMAREKRQIEQENRQIEQENRRIEQENRQIEQENRQLKNDKKKSDDRRKADDDKEKKNVTQRTTLGEFLRNYHTYLFRSLVIQSNIEQSTEGGTTDATGKYYPRYFRRWDDFIETQRRSFKIINDVLRNERLFKTKLTISEIKDLACDDKAPVVSKKDLENFEFVAIEKPVNDIIVALGKFTRHQMEQFNVSYISFANRFNSIGLGSSVGAGPESVGLQGEEAEQEITSREKGPSGPDRTCTRVDPKGSSLPAFIVEYKAAHKFPVDRLQVALSKENLLTEAVKHPNRTTTTSDPD